MFDRLPAKKQVAVGAIAFVGIELLLSWGLPKVMAGVRAGTALPKTVLGLAQFGLYWLYVLVLLFLTRDDWRRSLAKLRQGKLWGLILGTAFLSLLYDVLVGFLNLPLPANQSNNDKLLAMVSGSPSLLVAFLVTGVLVIPIIEELIFQYFFQRVLFPLLFFKLSAKWRSVVAVLLATILFILYHSASLVMSPQTLLVTFVSYGDLLLFAILFAVTDENIAAVSMAHIIVNLVSFSLMLAAM